MSRLELPNPARLYLAADGPTGDASVIAQCEKTRDAILKTIDWPCEVKTLFRDHNLGIKLAVSGAIDWFFENEEEGIIIEDDCLPANSFFKFCDQLLKKYRDDKRVWLISGCNFQNGAQLGDGSYYFSNLTNGWGWASWRRSWHTYDVTLNKYNDNDAARQIDNIFTDPFIAACWKQVFTDTKAGVIDTWDYQVTFAHLFSHSVNIIPNVNLVSNIGFGNGASNTVNTASSFANVPLQEMEEIIHPVYFNPQTAADNKVLYEEFRIVETQRQLKKHNSLRRRLKRFVRSLFAIINTKRLIS